MLRSDRVNRWLIKWLPPVILVEIVLALMLFSMVCYSAFTLLVEGKQN